MGLLRELLSSILHPREIRAMFKVKYGGMAQREPTEPLDKLAQTLGDVEFCYATLHKVSRSFAVVIQQLPESLKDPVCIFYLVLRGLDSVEDDMTFPNAQKLPLLRSFHEKMQQEGWRIKGVGDSPDYRILLANFHKVISVHRALKPGFQAVIEDICKRMGHGMAKFAERKVQSVDDYNEYCHYVAGLVGYGLSGLFSASGLEDPDLKDQLKISNSMGLFLQKTNIIRDYLEDLNSGRTFWPDEVWRKYASELSHFKANPTAPESLACLNHLVTDALQHVPDCLEYMKRIRDPQVFRFCAIPQVMAIATLAEVYNNPDVFRRVVKIRKGLSCQMMVETNNMVGVHHAFRTFADDIAKRVPPTDPSAKLTTSLVEKTRQLTPEAIPKSLLRFSTVLACFTLIVVTMYLFSRYRDRHSQLGSHAGQTISIADFTAVLALFASVGYLFGFMGMQYV